MAVARGEVDAALLELTRRYFVTRGPATLKDFAWWSGLTVADASRGVQIAGQSLEREVIGDETYWSDARGVNRGILARPSHRG